MPSLDQLTAGDLRAVVRRYAEALAAHRDVINRLNVYPVPDGDTGTNMSLTLRSVLEAVDAVPDELGAVCQAISHGSLMGARGNSGVILSQVLRGLADAFRSADVIDAAVVAAAFAGASEAAYGAVMKPVEGTILTVVRESADAAVEVVTADGDAALVAVLDRARIVGGESLARTPDLLPVLAEAGVVDAGGSGYLLLLDALLDVVDGRPIPEPSEDEGLVRPDAHLVNAGISTAHGEGNVADLRYEVMYFLEAPDEAVPGFKDVWATIGDSIVVVGGDGLFNCHIHTDDIGASIEAGIDIGRPTKIRVSDLLEQVEEERWVREAEPLPPEPASASEPVPCAVVAIANGDGVRRILYSLGVQGIVTGGQTMNPSTAQLLEAVEAAPADEVVILPNNGNIIAVANQVDAQTAKTVRVVPTRSIAEGFASLLAYDPHATSERNTEAMTETAENVIAAEVTRAVRNSTCDLGPIAEGDYIGLVREGVIALGSAIDDVCTQLLDRIVTDSHEIITIIEGEGASAATTRHIELWLQDHRPGATAEVHHGGQPLYPYLFGIE